MAPDAPIKGIVDEGLSTICVRPAAMPVRFGGHEGLGKGYRLIVNCNRDAGQEVFHLHMHLLGGRRIGPLVAPR